jgi:hypothetical protein
MDFQVVVATIGALVLAALALMRQRAPRPATRPVAVRIDDDPLQRLR